ncbi:MAG: biopolymer transporter ExbD [Cyanobacteria bacterium P01_H01_bin.15]
MRKILVEDVDETSEVNVLPLIDVIFAILAYFILASLYLTQAEGLPVNLPSAQTAPPQEQNDFTVTIQEDGTLALDEEVLSLEGLRSSIEAEITPEQITVVIIKADEKAYHGNVVEVMDELRQIEDIKLGVATQSKKSSAN